MASLRANPRGSWATIVGSLIIAASVLLGSTLIARGTSHDQTFYACLYAGSLSQVNTAQPSNCGRGEQISWNSQGIQGIQGVPGADGVSILTTVIARESETVDIAPGTTRQLKADCLPGEIATGGGYQSSSTLTIYDSQPDTDNTPVATWYVRGRNTTAVAAPFSAFVLCASTGVAAP